MITWNSEYARLGTGIIIFGHLGDLRFQWNTGTVRKTQ